MNSPRFYYTATSLVDGTALLAGGGNGSPNPDSTASADVYDPTGGIFKPTNGMNAPRENQTATLLADGRVLLAGGGVASNGSDLGSLATSELFAYNAPTGSTPTGSPTVQLTDATTSTSMTLSFSNVTQGGNTTLTVSGTGAPPPSGFRLGNPPTYYQLSTTAVFSGSVTICINYSGISFGNASKLRLFHYANNAWVDVTTSNANQTVCGVVTSLSPFAIFESPYSAAIQSPVNADGSSVFNASRGVVPVKFTLSLDGTVTCSLPPATIAVFRTSGGIPVSVNEVDYLQPSDNGSNFRVDGCQYVYNIGANMLGPGSYSVQIIISAVPVGSAAFGLK
jgi:hypothetical protein